MEILNVTLNPNDAGSGNTLSNGNLTVVNSTNNTGIRATHGKTSGKWYWEIKYDSGSNVFVIGVSNKSYPLNPNSSSNTNRRSYYAYSGNKLPENMSYGTSLVISDIIGIALDLDNGTLEFYKNGVSIGISHTNVKELGEVYPYIEGGTNSGKTLTFNFGATPFSYPIPHRFYSYDGRQYGSVDKILISSKDEYYSVISEVMGAETAIPKMTSNTTPSGRAFASSIYSTTYDAWRAFNNLTEAEGYSSANGSGGVGYLGYEFVNPIVIGKYAVRSMSTLSILNRMPKDWTFEGSNNGTDWIILDIQVNQIWATISTEKEYFIDISKINSYKMYRINWTANNGVPYTGFDELKMYEFIAPNLLLVLSNQSEQIFLNHGMNKDTSIDLTSSKILERRYIVQDNSQLGSGKVFKQKIDTTKISIKNAMIE
jgi:hypothetical protein